MDNSVYKPNKHCTVSAQKVHDTFFYIAYAILLIRAILLVSTIKAYIPIESFGYKVLPRLIAYCFILFKICLTDRFEPKELIYILLVSSLMLVSIYFNKYLNLVDIIVLIAGSNGIKFKNIVKFYFKISLFLCILFIILSLAGIIENYVTIRGNTERFSFGNVYPTDFAAMVFYLQLCNAYLRKKDYSIFTVIFWIVISVLILKFCDARLDFILILSFTIVMYLKAKFSKLFSIRIIKFLLIYGFALACIIALVLHIAYTPGNAFFEFINKLISNRLKYGNIVIKDYGFSIFGQNIKMQGWGWNTDWDINLGYYYVDSGFLSVTLRYGIIMILILVASFCIVSKAEIKSGNVVLPIVILFIGITSIIDQHFFELAYSPFLFVISYAISVCSKRKRKSKSLYCQDTKTKLAE